MRGVAMGVGLCLVLGPLEAKADGPTDLKNRPPRPPANLFSLLTRAQVQTELEWRHAMARDFSERIETVTRGLLGASYILSPLGEGAGRDPDPRFRWDAFDCTTFVETALALAYTDELDEAARLLDEIRYRNGKTVFIHRRHLMTAQWIPDLIGAGFAKDVTQMVGGDATERIDFKLTKKRWTKRRVAKDLDLPLAVIPKGVFPLDYVPLAAAKTKIDRVPPGTIVNVIRFDWPKSPEIVTHQGLVVVKPGGDRRWVRHASPVSRRIIDESLEHMLERYIHPRTPRKWNIIGVHFMQIVDPETKNPS